MGLLVLTDLDGTLLDHDTYSHAAADPALRLLRRRGVPLVLCSSKTRAEMLLIHHELGLGDPFIAENGGGIFAPESHPLAREVGWRPAGEGWRVFPLGLSIGEVRRRLATFGPALSARGFGEMDEALVARLTGLSPEAAARARAREFNEPLVLAHPERDAPAFSRAAEQAGLTATRGGRFFHLLGGGDKGRAARLELDWYSRRDPELFSAALGDAENDLPLLREVDRAYLLARPDGSHADLHLPGLLRLKEPGPAGWNRAVLALLEERP